MPCDLVSAQGEMGCVRDGERLADLVTVMADNEISEKVTLKKPFDCGNQPVHVVFLNKNLPPPSQFRSKNLIFFSKKVDLTSKPNTEAARSLLNKLHGNETSRRLKRNQFSLLVYL